MSARALAIGQVYRLSASDIRYCIRIGSERFFVNQAAGVRDRQYTRSTKTPREASIQGVVAEFAMVHWLGTGSDLLANTAPNSAARDRGDLVVDGLRIDVKGPIVYAEHKQRPIQALPWQKAHMADVYALVTVVRPRSEATEAAQRAMPLRADETTYRDDDEIACKFHGFILGTELFNEQYRVACDGGGVYARAPEHLTTWDGLFAAAKPAKGWDEM